MAMHPACSGPSPSSSMLNNNACSPSTTTSSSFGSSLNNPGIDERTVHYIANNNIEDSSTLLSMPSSSSPTSYGERFSPELGRNYVSRVHIDIGKAYLLTKSHSLVDGAVDRNEKAGLFLLTPYYADVEASGTRRDLEANNRKRLWCWWADEQYMCWQDLIRESLRMSGGRRRPIRQCAHHALPGTKRGSCRGQSSFYHSDYMTQEVRGEMDSMVCNQESNPEMLRYNLELGLPIELVLREDKRQLNSYSTGSYTLTSRALNHFGKEYGWWIIRWGTNERFWSLVGNPSSLTKPGHTDWGHALRYDRSSTSRAMLYNLKAPNLLLSLTTPRYLHEHHGYPHSRRAPLPSNVHWTGRFWTSVPACFSQNELTLGCSPGPASPSLPYQCSMIEEYGSGNDLSVARKGWSERCTNTKS
ncbi:hypothetical protein PM082_024346 [Marasmius tenuissimus]|nr:hypothetical protein PM082_024346 [Marasmius tenuissimus]